jgi:hypothetical protein
MELTGQQMADEVTGSSKPKRWAAEGAWGLGRRQQLGMVVAETPGRRQKISSSEPPRRQSTATASSSHWPWLS